MAHSKIIGIDIGQKGGICLLENGNVIVIFEMPILPSKEVNGRKLFSFFSKYEDATCFIENVHAIPRASSTSTFSFGQQYGAVKALLRACEIPINEVKAKQWQKEMFAGMKVITKNGKTDTKKMSIQKAIDLYPIETFGAGIKKGIQDGLTDATLIATYGYKQLNQSL